MLEVTTHLTRAGYITEQMQPESLVIQIAPQTLSFKKFYVTINLFPFLFSAFHDTQRRNEYQNKCRIQIRETYSIDVWPISNVADVKEHRTLEGRLTIAREIVRATDLKILVLWQTQGIIFFEVIFALTIPIFIIA
ncbi:12461_t:CDS:2 [Entrophospora sp. SA101]|nr:12461_t:CDS:2 [Entrophospora sp. SA101]CAJ0869957.1 3410_t:CDS:2 [Entrophospora sp. SA101]CAJ0906203.1 901_t:CDS:2 [Entrophospora sp. SA101]CAJ0921753.1 8147_t:CDS:2 [Entrophospora sp. SA101]